jgi:hypothetical protein
LKKTCWRREDFFPRVERIWRQPIRAKYSLENVQIKLENVKNDLKGWGENIRGMDKKRKQDLHLERTRQSGRAKGKWLYLQNSSLQESSNPRRTVAFT